LIVITSEEKKESKMSIPFPHDWIRLLLVMMPFEI